MFNRTFLTPCEAIRQNVGVVMFEFSRFHQSDYEHGRDFVADLDNSFGALPKDWLYAVEMRNKHWIAPKYFACLSRHGITHVFSSRDAMPPVNEQMAIERRRTNPQLAAARFFLKPGRKYEEAVKAIKPYDRVKDKNPEAQAAGKVLIAEGKEARQKKKTFIHANNRLEGNALEITAAKVEQAG